MSWFSRKVQVTFIDDSTGTVFATSPMQPADLPDSFEIATKLHFNGTDWSVVHAEPMAKSEFKKSCSLTLRLQKIENIPLESISYSQLDITDRFDENLGLGADDWISTTPLNATTKNPEAVGLPSTSANAEEVYQVALRLSALRESIQIPNDGVYCPICHIANVDLRKLRTPCPNCGRELLKFGWD